jgi:hypothetical protein
MRRTAKHLVGNAGFFQREHSPYLGPSDSLPIPCTVPAVNMFGRASTRCESHLRVSGPSVLPRCTQELFCTTVKRCSLQSSSFRGGCSTIAPNRLLESGCFRFRWAAEPERKSA